MNADTDRVAQPVQPDVAAPLVSVIVPTRHRPVMVAQAVRSILAQTEHDLELLVVIDGPDPATAEVLDSLNDRRLRALVHERCRGVSAARNTGLAEARGQWVAFCDDDDLWAPGKLCSQLDALRSDPDCRWCVVGEIRIEDGRTWGRASPIPAAEDVRHELPHWNMVPAGCSGVVADRKLVLDVGGFDERLSTTADWDLWIRLGEASPVAVARESLVAYRDHPDAMTRRLRRLEDELEVIRTKYSLHGDTRHFPGDMFYIWILRRTFRVGDWRGGLQFARRSRRFRRVMARRAVEWLRAVIRARVSPAVQPVPEAPIVSIDTHPWMSPIATTR